MIPFVMALAMPNAVETTFEFWEPRKKAYENVREERLGPRGRVWHLFRKNEFQCHQMRERRSSQESEHA